MKIYSFIIALFFLLFVFMGLTHSAFAVDSVNRQNMTVQQYNAFLEHRRLKNPNKMTDAQWFYFVSGILAVTRASNVQKNVSSYK